MRLPRRVFLATGLAVLAAPHVARAQPRRLRLGHNNPANGILQDAAVAMDAALKAATSGRLSLDIVPNSALGNESQMTRAVAEGSLDITLTPLGPISALAKEAGLLEAPFLFRDSAHARAALAGPLGAHCGALVADKGLTIPTWTEVGLRHITANRPIRSQADLRGLKIRVPLSDVFLESFRAMGAAAEPLPWPQVPEALRTGRFEAQENQVGGIIASRLNQHQSHLSLTGHVFTIVAFAISNDVMEELSEADRGILAAAARAGAAAANAETDRIDREGLASLRAAGMTIATDIDRDSMKRAGAQAMERLAAVFGADAVRRIGSLAA